jgi:hypothetical protein
LAFAAIFLLAQWNNSASAIELVRDGKPLASIVIPEKPLPVESYAADELQYHIEAATGAKLPIVNEGQPDALSAHVCLGSGKSASAEKIDPSALPGNSYIIKTAGANLYIAGSDTRGDPLSLDTRAGTLFGVYDVLENQMHVRWLWPGKLGEVIPKSMNLSLAPPDAKIEPLLWFKEWRHGKNTGEDVWLRRQRFGRTLRPGYGHSFGKYWERFGKTHPEYFAMLPDGTRRLDPTSDGPEYEHMCVSEPGLVKQIIADWKAKGSPRFINVCENDGWAGCACERCLSWDQPDRDNPVPFNMRLEAARKVFDRRGDWQLQLGSLSDRYARFWQAVADEAKKTRPDVTVISYVYDNYRKPPVKATLSPNVLCGVVPNATFPYSRVESDLFRAEWAGWQKTGCVLFLRPNYTSQAPNFPAFYARTLGEDLKFAMAHGVKGMDFDSLDSQYAAQGPTLYTLANVLNHPDADVNVVLDDFYSAFGPAKPSVKAYFELWESIYPKDTMEEFAKKLHAKRKYGAGTYGPFYVVAGEVFTPDAMTKADALLQTARAQAAADPLALARVEWLGKGLKHAELILATQRAYEQGVDSGDKAALKKAYAELKAFRAENADYDAANFAGISAHNEKVWKGAD